MTVRVSSTGVGTKAEGQIETAEAVAVEKVAVQQDSERLQHSIHHLPS